MLNTVTCSPTQPPTGDVTQQQLQYVRQILPALSLSLPYCLHFHFCHCFLARCQPNPPTDRITFLYF